MAAGRLRGRKIAAPVTNRALSLNQAGSGASETLPFEHPPLPSPGLGYGFSAAVQPGPFQTYLISQTLLNGWRRALIAGFSPLVSEGLIILTVLFVLTRVPETFRLALQVAGGGFILYLAWGAYRAWRRFEWLRRPFPLPDSKAWSAPPS